MLDLSIGQSLSSRTVLDCAIAIDVRTEYFTRLKWGKIYTELIHLPSTDNYNFTP